MVDTSSGEEGCGHETGEGLKAERCVVPQACDAQQQISDESCHDLDGDGVAAAAEEVGDLQVLLEPFEEQFDLPARLVERGDLGSGRGEVVGDEHDLAAGVDLHADKTQLVCEGVAAL